MAITDTYGNMWCSCLVARSAAATSTVVEQFTDEINLRLRGRSFALRVDSSDEGVAWRLGSPRVDVKPDGRR